MSYCFLLLCHTALCCVILLYVVSDCFVLCHTDVLMCHTALCCVMLLCGSPEITVSPNIPLCGWLGSKHQLTVGSYYFVLCHTAFCWCVMLLVVDLSDILLCVSCHTAFCWSVRLTALCRSVVLLCVDLLYCFVLMCHTALCWCVITALCCLQRVRAHCLSSWPQWRTVLQSTCGSVLLPSSPGCHTGHWVSWMSSQMSLLFWHWLSWMSSQMSLLFWLWLSWMSVTNILAILTLDTGYHGCQKYLCFCFYTGHWLWWMSFTNVFVILTLYTGCHWCQSEISLFLLHMTLIIMDVILKKLAILTLDTGCHWCQSEISLFFLYMTLIIMDVIFKCPCYSDTGL